MQLVVAFGHVTVVGACSYWLRPLHRNSLRQIAINGFHRQFVALPGPAVDVDWLLLPGIDLGPELQAQGGGKVGRLALLCNAFHKACIPHAVKIWAEVFIGTGLLRLLIKKSYGHAVPAVIVVVGGVEGLVKVADQVNHEHQRLGLLGVRSRRRPQHVQLAAYGAGDASGSGGARIKHMVSRGPERDIGEVPRRRLFPLFPDIVGPGGHLGKGNQTAWPTKAVERGVAGLVLQEPRRHGTRMRTQLLERDHGDGAVSFAAPWIRRDRTYE